jgi:hypothetical protein
VDVNTNMATVHSEYNIRNISSLLSAPGTALVSLNNRYRSPGVLRQGWRCEQQLKYILN